MSDRPKLSQIRHGCYAGLTFEQGEAMLVAIDSVLALCGDPGEPQHDGTGNFLGFTSLKTHRTVGARAWSDCGEWCYPSAPCPTCLPPVTGEQIRATIAGHIDVEG